MDFVQGGTNWRRPILFLPLSFSFFFIPRVNIFEVVCTDFAEYYRSNWYSRVLMEARSDFRRSWEFSIFFFFSFFSSFAQGFVVTPAFPVLFFSSIIFLPFVTAMLNQVYFTFDSFQVKSVFLYSIMTNMIVLIPNLFFYIFILTLLTRNLMKIFSFIRIKHHSL